MHMQACLNTLRAGLIASRVDLIWQMHPGVVAGPLVIGSIAGTGGRFAIDPVLGGFGHLEGMAPLAQAASTRESWCKSAFPCMKCMPCCGGKAGPFVLWRACMRCVYWNLRATKYLTADALQV